MACVASQLIKYILLILLFLFFSEPFSKKYVPSRRMARFVSLLQIAEMLFLPCLNGLGLYHYILLSSGVNAHMSVCGVIILPVLSLVNKYLLLFLKQGQKKQDDPALAARDRPVLSAFLLWLYSAAGGYSLHSRRYGASSSSISGKRPQGGLKRLSVLSSLH